jgi:hypothetical protein
LEERGHGMISRSVAWESVLPLATLLLLALVAAGLLWGPGLLNTRGGGDSPFNLLRVHQLAANLRAGIFPARWMPDAAYGLGYPFFSYYAALPYYLAAGFTLIGIDILSAIKLTQTLFFAVAALGMYGWGRRALKSRAGGWLAAAAYTVAPYHLVNVYVRGDSLSEFAAFAFYPLVLWGLDRLADRPSLPRTIPPALAYAGLIVTHNLSAFIFSLLVLPLYFALHVSRFTFHVPRVTLAKRLLAVSRLTAPLLIGALLSAWYWLPALAETKYVQLTAQTSGYFSYDKHFRGMDLVQPKLIFDYYAVSPDQSTAFAAMGLVQAVLALAGAIAAIIALTRPRFANRCALFALTGLLLTTWLVTPLSRPLWDRFPALQMVQFPWRILSVQALFAALLAGMLAGALPSPVERKEGERQWIVAAVLVIILAVAGLAGLRPEYLPIAAEEVTIERLQLYELFTGNIGTTIRYEWLPRWAVPRPFTGPALLDPSAPPQAIPLNGALVSAEETLHRPTRRTWTVEVNSDDAEVAFPLYYWPGWRAAVDGTRVETRPASGSGYLTLTVPGGEHVVEMWLGRTPVRMGAELAPLAMAMIVLAVRIFERRQRTRGEKPEARNESQGKPENQGLVICLLSFVVFLALLVTFQPRVNADAADLTMDFDHMPYLHHNPGGVAFDGWRLIGYEYSADRLAPGNTLHVALDGEAERETASATLRLVSPAAVRRAELSAIAETTATIATGTVSTALDLPIPGNAGPGMYLLQLKDEAALVYLRPVWISVEEMATGEPIEATFADGALRLHAVEATQTAPDRLKLWLDWSAGRPIAANYGISLRLTDPAGNEWARLDTQPGYGFLPTSLWPVNRLVHDRYALLLPEGAPPGKDYTLAVILYRAVSGESVGERIVSIALDQVTLSYDTPTVARFGDELALSRVEAPESVRQGEALSLTAYWLAVKQPSANYVAEWRLEAPEHTLTATLPLAPGSPPTTWPAHGWIAGRAALPIPPTAPPGDCILSLTVRHPESNDPLGSYALPQPVHVEGRERVWDLPQMQHKVGAHFGGMIELAGYDLAQEENAVRLTLYWRVLAIPDRNYTFFVHLADPATGRPATQVDTMPRGLTYPTGLWVTGEVVSDEVVLSLEAVPEGKYELAVGWYDPDDPSQRLLASDGEGNPLPDNRLVLPDGITVR